MKHIIRLEEHELELRRQLISSTISKITQKPYVQTKMTNLVHKKIFSLDSIPDDQDYEKVHNDRNMPEVALILSSEKAQLYFAFDEQWSQSNTNIKISSSKKPRYQFEFDGLHIRFYLGKNNGAIQQFARYEWEPMRKKPPELWIDKDEPEYTYDGQGAAHPHFHLDALQIDFKEEGFFQVSFEVSENSEVLSNDLYNQDLFSAGWIQHIHIPLKALWEIPLNERTYINWKEADATSALPHQHQPQDIAELNNWFEWVINYTIHQFELNNYRT